jgi:hypothetical protein
VIDPYDAGKLSPLYELAPSYSVITSTLCCPAALCSASFCSYVGNTVGEVITCHPPGRCGAGGTGTTADFAESNDPTCRPVKSCAVNNCGALNS